MLCLLGEGQRYVSIDSGIYHSAALTAEGGSLVLWGDDTFGQLGCEATNHSEFGETVISTPLGAHVGGHVLAVALGELHTLALTNGSTLFTFGNNERGQELLP